MPRAIAADWDSMKAAYLKGVPLPEVARQFNVSYSALRTRAHRYKWRDDAAAAATILKQCAARTMSERGVHWGERVATVVERHLDHMERADPAALKAKDFQVLVDTLERLDRIGRRTFGLDADGGPRAIQTLVQVNVPVVGGSCKSIMASTAQAEARIAPDRLEA